MSSPIKLVLGLAVIGENGDSHVRLGTPAAARELTETFRQRGYQQFDTARAYPPAAPGNSEKLMGEIGLAEWATLDTKVKSFTPGAHGREGIRESVKGCLEALRTQQVNVLYLHAPDRQTPFEETCEAMNEAYEAGHFKHFGLSNYSAKDVEEIVAICQKRGWVKPSVYQGGYNVLARNTEPELFPVLRKHGIAFYAYSPTAGGFLSGRYTKDTTDFKNSRFDTQNGLGRVFSGLYKRDEMFSASEQLQRVGAEAGGLNGHAIALRWIMHHSLLRADLGDAVILGASSVSQLIQNINVAEAGPLDQKLVDAVEAVWPMVKKVAPSYHL